ncbi:hypothetical protein IFM89_038916 [Coptis chinensis]|uniref:DUF7906 domain-containing protein n=1 Tax=Coptis chinensis TaxID=261450 RepID=A0A835IAH8_9MAGN|nr:hypothetical protein IFM89_038916 [Coptis chinensis]
MGVTAYKGQVKVVWDWGFFLGKDRYIWIDLAAGPVDYGPALSGDGVLPRGEFHPLAALHGRPKSQKTLLVDLASLVWSAYQVLLVPSLRIPVTYENLLVVQFIRVHGAENKDMSGLDWKSVERTFMDEILSDAQGEIKKAANVLDEEFGRVIPVYVFDLDLNKLMLLDRYHQSVAFKDMVIAVRTKSTQTKDAVRRNVLLTYLNYTITRVLDVFEVIAAHGGYQYLLRKGQHAEFVQRWNLLKYKLEKAVSAMSHYDFEMALYFIRSSDHDEYAIHSLVYEASQELEASLVCFKDPPFPWASVSIAGFGFIAFFFV